MMNFNAKAKTVPVGVVTVDAVMEWEPCEEYTREVVSNLFGGRETLTALEILDRPIPAQDRLWAVLRQDFIPDRELRMLACDFAEAVLPIWEKKYPTDDRPRKAIEAGRAFTKGEIDSTTLRAAWAAFRDARSVAMSASNAAAYAASNAAGEAAAGEAAKASRAAGEAVGEAAKAAGEAAGAASRAASRASWAASRAAWDAQIDMVRETLAIELIKHLMDCPHCVGQGESAFLCGMCESTGKVTQEQHAEYMDDLDEMERQQLELEGRE